MGAAIADEGAMYSWAIAAIFLLAVFFHAFPGAGFMTTIMMLLGIFVAFFLVKGAIAMAAGKGDTHLWTGIVFGTILILLFNGLPFVTGGLNLIFGIIAGLFSVIATIAVSSLIGLVLVVFGAYALLRR
ncbi:hypothetical protein HYS54_02545 [Candidatus Micrarchaeota archaeon]|nr:hypothetical protein [Candidatus Micrarchaeota archaeon]